jgi:hypothetical protein
MLRFLIDWLDWTGLEWSGVDLDWTVIIILLIGNHTI